MIPNSQAILKFHCPISLDDRAHHGLPVKHMYLSGRGFVEELNLLVHKDGHIWVSVDHMSPFFSNLIDCTFLYNNRKMGQAELTFVQIIGKKEEYVTAFSIFLARKYLQTIALGRRQQSDKGKGRQELKSAWRKSVNFPMIEVEAFQRNLFFPPRNGLNPGFIWYFVAFHSAPSLWKT